MNSRKKISSIPQCVKEVLNFFVRLIHISYLFTISDSFCETSRTDGTEIGTEIGTETGTEGTEIVEVQETIDRAEKKLRAEAVCITDPILEIPGECHSVEKREISPRKKKNIS